MQDYEFGHTALMNVCVCMYTYTHTNTRAHTHTHTHTQQDHEFGHTALMIASARGEAHLVRELLAHGACVCRVCVVCVRDMCTCVCTGANTELRSLCGVRTIDTHTPH